MRGTNLLMRETSAASLPESFVAARFGSATNGVQSFGYEPTIYVYSPPARKRAHGNDGRIRLAAARFTAIGDN